jgi:hypothetical protein
MKQLLSLVAAAAIGLGGMTGCSMWHHNDASASANNKNKGMTESEYQDQSKSAAFTEAGSAKIEDHRNDAGPKAQPASEKQAPATNDDNNNDFSD